MKADLVDKKYLKTFQSHLLLLIVWLWDVLESEKCTISRSGRPWSSDRTLRLVARLRIILVARPLTWQKQLTQLPLCHSQNIWRLSSQTGLLRQSSSYNQYQAEEHLAHEMVERSRAFWTIVIFADEYQFSLFSDNGRLWDLRLNIYLLDIKILQPTV